MRLVLQVIPNFELMLKSKVLNFSFVLQFDIKVTIPVSLEALIKRSELVGLHGGLKLIFLILNLLCNLGASANGSLWFFGIPVLIDPRGNRVLGAIELVRLLAIVSEVLEVKHLLTSRMLAFLGSDSFQN